MGKRSGIEPPDGGWHEDTAEALGQDAIEVRTLTAGEFFDIEQKCGTDGNKVSQAVLDKVVSIGGKEGALERLLALPLRDYAHIAGKTLEISGVRDSVKEEPDDPKPSGT